MSRPPAEVLDLPAHIGFVRRGRTTLPVEDRALSLLDADAQGLPPALAALVRSLNGPEKLGRRAKRLTLGMVALANLLVVGWEITHFDHSPLLAGLVGATLLGLLAAGLTLPVLVLVDRSRSHGPAQLPADAFDSDHATPIRQALAATPFVLWHDGRYIQNIRLPLHLVEQWLPRVQAALADTQRQIADLEAGDALLGELAGIDQGDGASDALVGLQQQRRRAEARHARFQRLERELAAARDDLAAEADRRRRPPEDGDTRVTWSLDLQDLVTDAVHACTTDRSA